MYTQKDYISLVAGEDIPQFRLVELSAGTAVLASTDSSNNVGFIGVNMIQNVKSGNSADIAIGYNKTYLVEASGNIAIGAEIMRDTDGTIKTATSGGIVVGYAITAGEAGSYVECVLLPLGWYEK